MTAQWTIRSVGFGPFHVHDITITGPAAARDHRRADRSALGLWWLLGHTRFGESVRATATNADLARLTGVSPKIMSTAIWTIAGFLSAVVGDPLRDRSRARPSSCRSARRRCCSGCRPR